MRLVAVTAPLLLLLLLGLLSSASVLAGAEAHAVPAIYVFGDSTVDVGNNQYLPGTAKVELPYGIDFPHSRATGRFSNGYNVADFIAKLLGFKRSPPAYLSLTSNTTHQLMKGLRGASYASGGSGILDTTGKTLTMTKQIEYFSATKSEIGARLDSKLLEDLLAKSLFLISAGGNDLFAFVAQNRSASQVPALYADLLSNCTNHITALYNLGARKFGIIDVPPIGCVPSIRVLTPTGVCVDTVNTLAKGFNEAFKILMATLSSKLKGMKYSIGGSYNIVSYIVAHPNATGFEDVQSACCGGGRLNAQIGCGKPNSTYCANRNQYVFWDGVHGTQATSKKGAFAIYSGNLTFAMPINFKQLVQDDSH